MGTSDVPGLRCCPPQACPHADEGSNTWQRSPRHGSQPSRQWRSLHSGGPAQKGVASLSEPVMPLVAHRDGADSIVLLRPMTNGSTPLNKHKLNIYQQSVGSFVNLSWAWVERRDGPALTPVDILSVDSKSSPVLDFPRWKSTVFPYRPQYIGSAGP